MPEIPGEVLLETSGETLNSSRSQGRIIKRGRGSLRSEFSSDRDEAGSDEIAHHEVFTELPVIIYDPVIAANLFYTALKSLISSRKESVAYLLHGISSIQPLQIFASR
ncbi:hypothetical protein ACTFIW_000817 [Dictyostelium discoideum]